VHSILQALQPAVPDPESGSGAGSGPDPGEVLAGLEAVALRAPQDVPAGLGRWLVERGLDTYLVVDDLHAVGDLAVQEQLVELVVASAGRLHLVAVARHDPPWPLHRMRLDGLLVNVRAESLAFDAAEAAELFASLGVAVTAERVGQLVGRTQGWAAGLRLAAMGASTAADPDRYLATVSGRDEYIADYLLREVYEGLSGGRREFLARIGVVDEVSGELAVALGAGRDSAVQLAELARQNAFVHQLGDRLGWYRLHPLLVDFLRSRATSEVERRSLHRRAARWFHRQGETWLAMTHALAAHDWDLAADLIGTFVASWTIRRSPVELKQLLVSVPREETLTRPGLAIGLAAALSMLGEPAEVPDLVAAARAQLGSVTGVRRDRYLLLLDLIGIGTDRWVGDLEAVRERLQRLPREPAVLGGLGLADWLTVQTLLISNLGTAELWTGQLESAHQHLSEAARADSLRTVTLPTLNAQAHLGYLHWIRGELAAAEAAGRAAVDGVIRLGIPTAVQARTAYLTLAGVAIDHDDLTAATRWLDTAHACVSERHTEFATDLMTARLAAAQGRLFEAVSTVRDTRHRHRDAPFPPHLTAQADLLETDLLTLAGHHPPPTTTGPTATTPTGAQPAGEAMLDGSIRAQVTHHLTTALHALHSPDDALHGPNDGQQAAALDALEAALALAAPHHLRRPFLAHTTQLTTLLSTRIESGTAEPDFAVDLLTRMAGQQPRPDNTTHPVLVPLTARETNILRYLATTLTVKEIAQTLYVSINTVKTHQRSIYQKLGAGDRREAVAHARQLALL